MGLRVSTIGATFLGDKGGISRYIIYTGYVGSI